jgi:serine/threonine-protein kinase RsbW
MRRTAADFARRHGASDRALESLSLALSEALTNVVVHAYRDAGAPGSVLLALSVSDGALLVTVTDEGCGFTPRPDSPGLGLGMGMMAQLADPFDVTARPDGPGSWCAWDSCSPSRAALHFFCCESQSPSCAPTSLSESPTSLNAPRTRTA